MISSLRHPRRRARIRTADLQRTRACTRIVPKLLPGDGLQRELDELLEHDDRVVAVGPPIVRADLALCPTHATLLAAPLHDLRHDRSAAARMKPAGDKQRAGKALAGHEGLDAGSLA